jgi:hypothetical protein
MLRNASAFHGGIISIFRRFFQPEVLASFSRMAAGGANYRFLTPPSHRFAMVFLAIPTTRFRRRRRRIQNSGFRCQNFEKTSASETGSSPDRIYEKNQASKTGSWFCFLPCARIVGNRFHTAADLL